MSQELDVIDTIATQAFEGHVVRKDLVRRFRGQYPVPTYVAEFLLDCKANIDFAYHLYQEQGSFTPWSTYTSGAYRRFLRAD